MGTHSIRASTHSLTIGLVTLCQLAACGGGGGGGGASPPQPPLPAQPAAEMLVDATRLPIIDAIGSDSEFVYLASQYEITRYDKTTGAWDALTGGQLIDAGLLPSCGEVGVIDFPANLIRDGDYLYFNSRACHRVQRVFVGNDGKSSLETVVPQFGLGGSISSLAGNDDYLFWASGVSIYKKAYSNDSPAQILAPAQSDSRMRAAASALYVTANPSGPYSLFRYDVATGARDTIQSNIALDAFANIPTATSPTKFFWVNGDVIYSVPHASTTPELLVSGLPNITQITADDTALYALQDTLSSEPVAIHRIDLANKTTTPVIALDDIRDVLVYKGKLYWVSGLGLYTLNPNGTAKELYVNDGSEIVIGGAGGAEMVGVSDRIFVSSGAGGREILFHDLAAGVTSVVRPIGFSFLIFANSHSLYYGTYNTGIVRVPPDLDNLRLPQTLAGNLAGVEKLFLDNGWLYWSEYSNFASVYRISRVRTDGSGFQILFNGVHRGLALYSGRLFFMCELACSLNGWTLVSMPLEGGTIVPEFGLALGPVQMIQKNGIFYVADTFDFVTGNIFAINLPLNNFKNIMTFVPYFDISLDASPKWFYVGHSARFKILGWDNLGGGEVFEPPSSDPFVFVHTIHTDAKHVYYWLWTKGLKRFAE